MASYTPEEFLRAFVDMSTPASGWVLRVTGNPNGTNDNPLVTSVTGGCALNVNIVSGGFPAGGLQVIGGVALTSSLQTITDNSSPANSSPLQLSTASVGVLVSNITNTSTDGFIVYNATAATVSVTAQWSPRIRMSGTAWKSAATAASETHNWINEVQTATGTSVTTSALVWSTANSAVSAGAYSEVMRVRAGFLTMGGTTASFPAWKRSTTVWQARLADDSDFTGVTASIFRVDVDVRSNNTSIPLDFKSGDGSVSIGASFRFIPLANYTYTTGTLNVAQILGNFTPSAAGNGNFRVLNVSYSVNPAAGAQTGTYTGILVTATEGASFTGTHNLFDLQTGAVSKFKVTAAGLVTISALPTSSAGLVSGTLWNDSGTVKVA